MKISHFILYVLLMVIVSCNKEEIEDPYDPYLASLYNPTYESAYIAGTLYDEQTGEPISGVNIAPKVTPGCWSSDITENGKFTLSICRRIDGQYPFGFPGLTTIAVYQEQEGDIIIDQEVAYLQTFPLNAGDTVYAEIYTTLTF